MDSAAGLRVRRYARGVTAKSRRLTPASGSSPERAALIIQEVLAALPAGCTWVLPVCDAEGQVVDYRIAAASELGHDVYGRSGGQRLDARLSELYPGMVGGPLWQLYEQVLSTGEQGRLPDFRYEEKRAGVVASSLFDVSAFPVLGGVLVWWERVDEVRQRLAKTELLGHLGSAEYDLVTGVSDWSPGMYRIFERDPADGPLSQVEQRDAILPDDHGLSETAWQTLDSGEMSDVTVRFRIGERVKHLRVLSDIARDASGTPIKIHAVVQDVTQREDSRTELQRLADTLQRREMTALAEHRLAGQLQDLIQPVPAEPFQLCGMQVLVRYVPSESAAHVGGDWFHTQELPDGRAVLAIGDVAGHGLLAAGGMAHLRFGLIAWLSAGVHEPDLLLRHMNRLCIQLEITATAVVAVCDGSASTLRWARAGHLAPLLARDGVAHALPLPRGLILGATEATEYPVVTTSLLVGDYALLYTDGLVERRPTSATSTADMTRQVQDALARASATADPAALLELGRQLSYPSPADDACAVAVRVVGVGTA